MSFIQQCEIKTKPSFIYMGMATGWGQFFHSGSPSDGFEYPRTRSLTGVKNITQPRT